MMHQNKIKNFSVFLLTRNKCLRKNYYKKIGVVLDNFFRDFS